MLAQVFSCEFREIFQNTFFTEVFYEAVVLKTIDYFQEIIYVVSL